MAKFLPLDGPKAFGILNSHLASESYINGVQPSADDVIVFKSLGTAPEGKWAHILRWYKHILHFGDAMNAWQEPKRSADEAPQQDEDIDLFAEETEEEKAANEARKQTVANGKPTGPIGRSAVILDIKPWGEDTDMNTLEQKVRQISVEGLEWKASKLVEIAYGIQKLQIMCHVIDDLVMVDDDVVAKVEQIEDLVQSVDIFAFNKL